MKSKFIALSLIAVFLLLGIASAKVLVAGKIYNSDYSSTIDGADVKVTCHHTGGNAGDYVLNNQSISDGTYAVNFPQQYEDGMVCDVGDNITVEAVKGDLVGTKDGVVWDGSTFDIPCELSVVNVPLVPEFGLLVGGLTLVSAIAVFFFIRRK